MTTTTTETRPAPELRLPPHDVSDRDVELVTHQNSGNSTAVGLTGDELRAIVQQAWDLYGIAAAPTDGADLPAIVENRHGHVLHRTADFTHAAHNQGVRA